jgi:hypothetical protein
LKTMEPQASLYLRPGGGKEGRGGGDNACA